MKKILLAAVLALTACDEKKSAAAPAAAEAAAPVEAPSGTQVATLPVSVDVPEGAEANGGAPGFHSEDGSVYVLIKAAAATDPQEFEAAKAAASEIGFTKWVKSEKTADGWALVWNGTGMDMDGKEYVTTAYSVRKKVGAASYDCYGSVKTPAHAEKNLKLCGSLKAFSE